MLETVPRVFAVSTWFIVSVLVLLVAAQRSALNNQRRIIIRLREANRKAAQVREEANAR